MTSAARPAKEYGDRLLEGVQPLRALESLTGNLGNGCHAPSVRGSRTGDGSEFVAGSVSRTARVYVLTQQGYVVADSGSGAVACYVSRSWRESIEPHCFDEEGARTIMPIEMREAELLHQGRSPEEGDREIAAGLVSGRFRLPQLPCRG